MSGGVRRVMAADGHAPSTVRRLFRQWLGELRWPAVESDDLLLAVSEAVSNATDHAYPPGLVGEVAVEADCELDGDGYRRVIVVVTDRGTWRPPPSWHENRRRGLPLMRACTERLDVRGTATGTWVQMVSNPVPALITEPCTGRSDGVPAARSANGSPGDWMGSRGSMGPMGSMSMVSY